MNPTFNFKDHILISKFGSGNYKLFNRSVLKTNSSLSLSRGDIIVFEYPMNKDISYTKHDFEAANLPVNVYDDLKPIQWSKLILNLNNSINALSGLPLKIQLSDRVYRKVLALSIKEALKVLNRVNIKTGKVVVQLIPYILLLSNSLFEIVASSMIQIDPAARSSMYEDSILGRHTEIDYLNGEIVDLAKHLNIPSPVNSAIMNLVETAEKQGNGSPMISAKELLNRIVG